MGGNEVWDMKAGDGIWIHGDHLISFTNYGTLLIRR